jgi:hypothetical protein
MTIEIGASPWLDKALGQRAHQTWSALSRASHYHPYELTSTHDELTGWYDIVLEFIDVTERSWRG